MTNHSLTNEHAGSFSRRQQLFFRYTLAVLIDLTVLNLFNEYWDYVFIEFFTISLFAAILLQFLLQVTIAIEHRVANYFKKKAGLRPRVMRGLSTWAGVGDCDSKPGRNDLRCLGAHRRGKHRGQSSHASSRLTTDLVPVIMAQTIGIGGIDTF